MHNTIKTVNKNLPNLQEDIKNFKDLSVSNYIRSFDVSDNKTLIFKYIDGTTLNHLNINLTPNILWPLFLQMITELKYIHERGYAHRNITMNNIVLTPDYKIKYINFELSSLEKDTDEEYLSPELLNDIDINLNISKAHDVWALVLIMKEITNNNYIYDDGRTNKFLEMIYIKDWKLRPTINMILDNFLTQIYSKIF